MTAPAIAALCLAAGLGLAFGRRPAAARLRPPVPPRRPARLPRAALDRAVAELAFALAAELRAGAPPGAALEHAAAAVGPLAAAVAAAGRAVARGAPLSSELGMVADAYRSERLRGLAAAWSAAAEAGGRSAGVLERLGAGYDAHDEASQELAALVAGPRATMALLAGLPAAGLALGQSIGARPVHLLLHRPLGWALLGSAAVLDGAGLAWARRITARAVHPR
jgi:tight adherence protein B